MRMARKFSPAAIVFPLIIVSMLVGAWLFREPLISVFSSPERVRSMVAKSGPWGAALFIALQTLQVVVFVIPGEIVQVAGGWLFGVFRGVLFSVAGIGLGAAIDFALARAFGRPFAAALFGAAALDRLDGIVRSNRSAAVFFILFVVPGIPKDALCYAAGLSSISPAVFLAVSMAGRLPGIVGSSVIGRAASDGRYQLAVGIAAAAAVLFVLGAVFKDRIHDALARRAAGEEPVSEEPERRREEA